MDIFEPIRRGYHAMGFGADADVLGMLDQGGPEPACWEVHSLDFRVRSRPAGEVAALDLFGRLPAQYELVHVQVRTWSPSERHARLVVGGGYRVRVRGTDGGVRPALQPCLVVRRRPREGRAQSDRRLRAASPSCVRVLRRLRVASPEAAPARPVPGGQAPAGDDPRNTSQPCPSAISSESRVAATSIVKKSRLGLPGT